MPDSRGTHEEGPVQRNAARPTKEKEIRAVNVEQLNSWWLAGQGPEISGHHLAFWKWPRATRPADSPWPARPSLPLILAAQLEARFLSRPSAVFVEPPSRLGKCECCLPTDRPKSWYSICARNMKDAEENAKIIKKTQVISRKENVNNIMY